MYIERIATHLWRTLPRTHMLPKVFQGTSLLRPSFAFSSCMDPWAGNYSRSERSGPRSLAQASLSMRPSYAAGSLEAPSVIPASCPAMEAIVSASPPHATTAARGAFDMVGNVYEWVADWVPRSV